MIYIRSKSNQRLWKLQILFINKRRFYGLVMPGTLSICLRNLYRYLAVMVCVRVLMPGDHIMQQLPGCDTQNKQQQ